MTTLSRAIAVWLLIYVGGCATTGGYENILNSWVGKNVSELMISWGPPAGAYPMPDGRMLYTWLHNAGAVAMPVGNMAVAVPRGCKTTFITQDDGTVQSWRWEGNACKA